MVTLGLSRDGRRLLRRLREQADLADVVRAMPVGSRLPLLAGLTAFQRSAVELGVPDDWLARGRHRARCDRLQLDAARNGCLSLDKQPRRIPRSGTDSADRGRTTSNRCPGERSSCLPRVK